MPPDGLNKVDLENTQGSPSPASEKAVDSVLVPKIELTESKPEQPQNSPPQPTSLDPKSQKRRKIWKGAFILLGLFLIYNLVAGFLIYRKGSVFLDSVRTLQASAETKDLAVIRDDLKKAGGDIRAFGKSLKLVSWARIIPYYGRYVSDVGYAVRAGEAGFEAGEILIVAIEPYADLLGLVVNNNNDDVLGEKTPEQTTQDRIDFIIKTIPEILPKIDEISAKAKTVDEELAKIDPQRYPETFRGNPLRSKLKSGRDLVQEIAVFVGNIKPVLESAPYLLGMDSPRNYFLVFQNDKELRPTGGFLTAYAIMKVDKATFEPVSSNDIYNLDALYKPSIPAPEPIVNYIKGPYILSKNLRLRDMNWSPDFEVSMDLFSESIKEAGVKDIDGIIAVDTQLLTNLLDVIGSIGVPGFGNFSTDIDPECNCPQVIHELESFADVEGPIVWDPVSGEIVYKPKNADNRKSIIGPLMNSVLSNAYAQPKEKLPALFEAGFKSLIEKHVLFYLFEDEPQKAMRDFGLGGAINSYDGDYLHINDANLGGRKSNLYATQDVEQVIEVAKDGTVTKTLTITHKNPERHDGWLNSVLPTWVRVYVPKGSRLIASEGLETKADPYEELGKTVFAGFFQLRPEGVSKLTFKYELPFKVTKEYKMLIQKQPGTDGFLYTVQIGKYRDEFFLKTDKEIKVSI
jgi:hypothetical protein